MSCSNEIWRSSTYTLPSSGDPLADSFRGVTGGSRLPSESADHTVSLSDRLVGITRMSVPGLTLSSAEKIMNGYWTSYADPYTNRIFGATILATNFSVVNNQLLQSGSDTICCIYLPYTAQTATAANWQSQMSNLVTQAGATGIETARTNHYNWWDAFWNRSWIFCQWRCQCH